MKKIIAFFLIFIIIFAPVTVLADVNTTINIDTVKISKADDTAWVDVNITENSGISAMTISFTYDSSALEYVSFKEGIFSDYSVKDFKEENYIRLVVLEDEDIKEDGLLLSLGFKVKDAEKGKLYPVSIEYSEGDFCNSKGEAVSPKIVSGGIAYLQADTTEQNPSKYESSSASSQSASVSESSSQSASVNDSSSQNSEATFPHSSTLSSSSQMEEQTENIEANTQSEVTSSEVKNDDKNEKNLKWIIIPIVIILVVLVIFALINRKKK